MARTFDPSVSVAQVLYPRPVTGFRRVVQVSHPLVGVVTLLSTEASLSDSGSPNFTKYASTPGVGFNPSTPGIGPKQKAIHSAGTKEVTWTVGGEVTAASLGLLALLAGSARGVNFSQLSISQGSQPQSSFLFDNLDGNSLPWAQFTLNGNQNAGLTFSLEGKATVDPFPEAALLVPVVVSPPVPSWATGNDFVTSWSLSHNVNLQPYWFNSQSMFPKYYRALDSEFTLQLTTAVMLSPYAFVRIGFGSVTLLEAVVTAENITFGDRNNPISYSVSSTNAAVSSPANAYTEFVNIVIGGVPDSGYS